MCSRLNPMTWQCWVVRLKSYAVFSNKIGEGLIMRKKKHYLYYNITGIIIVFQKKTILKNIIDRYFRSKIILLS